MAIDPTLDSNDLPSHDDLGVCYDDSATLSCVKFMPAFLTAFLQSCKTNPEWKVLFQGYIQCIRLPLVGTTLGIARIQCYVLVLSITVIPSTNPLKE